MTVISSEKITKGRRYYGDLLTLGSGRKVYLARRFHKEIFRNRRKSISEALREGVADWAIDDWTLALLKRQGVEFVGVKLRDTGDIYMTTIKRFYDYGKPDNFTSRGGSRQYYLNMEYFQVRRYARVK